MNAQDFQPENTDLLPRSGHITWRKINLFKMSQVCADILFNPLPVNHYDYVTGINSN